MSHRVVLCGVCASNRFICIFLGHPLKSPNFSLQKTAGPKKQAEFCQKSIGAICCSLAKLYNGVRCTFFGHNMHRDAQSHMLVLLHTTKIRNLHDPLFIEWFLHQNAKFWCRDDVLSLTVKLGQDNLLLWKQKYIFPLLYFWCSIHTFPISWPVNYSTFYLSCKFVKYCKQVGAELG